MSTGEWLVAALIVAIIGVVFVAHCESLADCKAAGGVYVRAATTTGYACVKTEVIKP